MSGHERKNTLRRYNNAYKSEYNCAITNANKLDWLSKNSGGTVEKNLRLMLNSRSFPVNASSSGKKCWCAEGKGAFCKPAPIQWPNVTVP